MAHGKEKPSRNIPEWASREREGDLAWIGENVGVFWPAAQSGFKAAGRGAIVVEIGTRIPNGGGEGHPFLYMPAPTLAEQKWEDVMRLVNGYDPTWEFVTVLLKDRRESAYRVGIPAARLAGRIDP